MLRGEAELTGERRPSIPHREDAKQLCTSAACKDPEFTNINQPSHDLHWDGDISIVPSTKDTVVTSLGEAQTSPMFFPPPPPPPLTLKVLLHEAGHPSVEPISVTP
ncbi:unnamed protein product [Caretta caretta]